MSEQIALRLNARDRENLTTIATALNEQRPAGAAPWRTQATITRCLRTALEAAAKDAIRASLSRLVGEPGRERSPPRLRL